MPATRAASQDVMALLGIMHAVRNEDDNEGARDDSLGARYEEPSTGTTTTGDVAGFTDEQRAFVKTDMSFADPIWQSCPQAVAGGDRRPVSRRRPKKAYAQATASGARSDKQPEIAVASKWEPIRGWREQDAAHQ